MRSSPSGPTPGLKIMAGLTVWMQIERGHTFTLSLGSEGYAAPAATALPGTAKPPVIVKPAHIVARGQEPLFERYEFADFSGAKDKAQQRKSIRLAIADAAATPADFGRSLTRETLQQVTLRRLEEATRDGVRVAFGRDHQYSIPAALSAEIGLGNRTWREALDALVLGTYGGPPMSHASGFARGFNDWLIANGRPAYFFSCTKGSKYDIPTADPRPSRYGLMDPTTYRLTELSQGVKRGCLPKPLNRVGDNGTVGGQTLVGLVLLHELLFECQRMNIPLAVWPFDGLDIRSAAYEGHHVMFEPYPSAVRDAGVVQTDLNDAVASVLCVQRADQGGQLPQQLDLVALSAADRLRVAFEGWIVGHRPGAVRGK
jgi:hypothetical protein